MVPSPQSTTDHGHLAQTLSSVGLRFLGVADVPAGDDPAVVRAREAYRNWLAGGHHGTMAFLGRHEAGKYDPRPALEGTRSVVLAGLGYRQEPPAAAPGTGRVARYAWGRDYHKVLLAKLRQAETLLARRWPGQRWRSFTDTAPLDERWWAARAGAAFTGRHALSINRDLGSWFLLGEILTTLEVEPTGPQDHAHGSCPSGCRRCRDACPTGALSPEGRLDPRRCLSYLTIEHRGPVAADLKPLAGEWIFGCDRCQEACPLNLRSPATDEPEFLTWKAGPALDPAEILVLDGPSFTARFGGSPVHRATREGMVRNACLTAARLGRADLVPVLETLTRDPDPGVADAASWAVIRLSAGKENG